MSRQTRHARKLDRANAAHPNVTSLDTSSWHPSSQATAARAPASPHAAPRRGLVTRARAFLVRRHVERVTPALLPALVAAAGVLILVGVVVGLALGIALAAGAFGDDDQ